ncbi:LacI family DNA-binding transcriptional regulator [Agathobacter ruminis]|uniref:LacI family transcriptional regulator n=3 Tax=Agathobacter TaxID=1766253 RepID=A0A2G3E1I7_9FIRM|nr:LacI family DNA-binding transcriptional regulator [Agathobacter ruminis]MDC7301916.1 LacI family DNA-binding transcriptional regulator [Agathobacter ruminis]PHU37157.1 LacI family transcriptional regulator [Agathobacter ruminis]
MSHRVTLQQIAKELGLSRNTVSRALNNSQNVSAETRALIYEKAQEMGYKQFIEPTIDNSSQSNFEIALFTQSFPGSSHSGSKLLEAFQHKINQMGYKFSINIIRDQEIRQLSFPANFNKSHVAGILCLEMFSVDYCQFLCRSEIPMLFVDTPAISKAILPDSDKLYMENFVSTHRLISSLIQSGCRHISFVGDRYHCQSFYERWQAYQLALTDAGIPIDLSLCILADDTSPYSDPNWLCEQIANLPVLPDAFFCANDFLSLSCYKALRFLGKKVPDDTMLCGFDDAPEASLLDPGLTTVHIHNQSMGILAAELLLSRIKNPAIPYRTSYVDSEIIYRGSTKKVLR